MSSRVNVRRGGIRHASLPNVDSSSDKCIAQSRPGLASNRPVRELQVCARPLRAVRRLGTAEDMGDLVQDSEFLPPGTCKANDPSIALSFWPANSLYAVRPNADRLDAYNAWEPFAPPIAATQSVQVLLDLDDPSKRSARIKGGFGGIDRFGAHDTS